MAMTLDDLQKDVLSRLNEASDSPIGEFHAGDGSAAVITTKDTITKYLNDAAYDLARYCVPLSGKATYSLASNQKTARLQDFTVTGGGTLFVARQVQAGSVALEHCNRSYAEIYYPEFDSSGTATTTKYWFFDGQSSIAFAPIPSTGLTITVSGYILPPALVNLTDTIAWIEPDLYKLMVYYAAYMIAIKNLENGSLKERAPLWNQAWQDGKNKLLANLAASDPRLFRAHFAVPDAKV